MNNPHNPTASALILQSPTMDWWSSSSSSASFVPSSSSSSQAAVACDLLQAVQDENLYDVELVSSSCNSNNSNCAGVPANRFVLAARSPVFRKMLYGRWREAQTGTICLSGDGDEQPYAPDVLRAVVSFCSFDCWHEAFPAHDIALLVQLTRAADYLELHRLKELAEDRVLDLLSSNPAAIACTVLQQAWDGSHLATAALQMMECRPYVALMGGDDDDDDNGTENTASVAAGGGVEVLSAEKLELVLQNAAVGAGEWFLFGLLLRWYKHQLQQLQLNCINNNDTQREKKERDIVRAAQRLASHLRLSNIEPERLLSPIVQSCPWIPRERIFEAVAQQALQASQDKVWRLQCRGGRSSGSGERGVDRILVEGAGSRDVNGLYYRIAPGLANRSDLYSKREVACGQQFVYTLSRCLIRKPAVFQQDSNSNDTDNNDNPQQTQEYYEFRIFCSKFLTHRAVQSLVQMQSTATLVPYFQPVLQVLNLQPPADNDNNSSSINSNNNNPLVPTPIRKFYRLRLSDGDFHMPATLSDSFNAMIEQRELREKYVLQVLEFGVYTVFGTVGIHVIRAAVVTSTPAYVFGNPVPLEEAAAGGGGGEPMSVDNSNNSNNDNKLADSAAALRNLYRCQCPVDEQLEHTSKIPRTGWQVDAHGREPAPHCSWIPDHGSINADSTAPPVPRLLHLLHNNDSNKNHSESSLGQSGNISDDDDI